MRFKGSAQTWQAVAQAVHVGHCRAAVVAIRVTHLASAAGLPLACARRGALVGRAKLDAWPRTGWQNLKGALVAVGVVSHI